MKSIEQEEIDLGAAERHIVEGEERVTRQRLLLERLRADGHSEAAADAEKLLDTLLQTLEEWRGHRSLIMAEIDRLRALAAKPGLTRGEA